MTIWRCFFYSINKSISPVMMSLQKIVIPLKKGIHAFLTI